MCLELEVENVDFVVSLTIKINRETGKHDVSVSVVITASPF